MAVKEFQHGISELDCDREACILQLMKIFKVSPIGVIHSPYKRPEDVGNSLRAEGIIELFPEYAKALKDIEGFSHLYVLWWAHLSRGFKLVFCPFRERIPPPRGLFATRSPQRVNPIGLTIVRLSRRKGRFLYVKGLDMVDGTPLLDIKPYTRRDRKSRIRTGWLEDVERGS